MVIVSTRHSVGFLHALCLIGLNGGVWNETVVQGATHAIPEIAACELPHRCQLFTSGLPLGTRRVRAERDKGCLRGPCRFSGFNMELIREKFRERVWLAEEQGGRHAELVRKFIKVDCSFVWIEWSAYIVWTQDPRWRGEEGVSFCPSVSFSQVNWATPQDSKQCS